MPRALERIQEKLQQRSFEFAKGTGVPVQRAGKEDPRPIVVQPVGDRIVQRAVLDTIMAVPAVPAALENGVNFGGIPNGSVRRAIEPIRDAVDSDVAQYYIRSDISAFFARIPREKAIEELLPKLPDRSLDQFIRAATVVELENAADLERRDLITFFPDPVTGVPQGHALSALLGNLLLSDFDELIRTDETVGVRYLDDFVILGSDKAVVWRVFRRAREFLAACGLECYKPGKSAKASEGSAQSRFEFLGCEVSRGFVKPSRANRRKLIGKVREKLDNSAARMTSESFHGKDAYPFSVVNTLGGISRMLRGWSEQYAFCNYAKERDALDEQIDDLLGKYIGLYADRRKRVDRLAGRRMLGVWTMGDAGDE